MTEAESFYQSEAFQYYQEGYKQQMEGHLDEAIGLYQKSLQILPTAEAHTFLGWAYSFQGRYEDAIRECHAAIDLDPDFGNPYNDIGAYLIEQGRFDEAMPWFEKAIEAKRYETYCYPHYNLGRVWEKKGNWMRALGSYQSALDDNPEYELARRAVHRIQALMN